MSAQLKSVIQLLEFVASIKSSQLREQLLTEMSKRPEIYKALREIAYNIVNKNISLDAAHKKKLKAYKSTIVALSGKQKTRQKKQKLVVRSGGFLPILIPLVLSLLNGLQS